MSEESQEARCRLGLFGAISAIVGIVLSGPLAAAIVSAVHAQPRWQDASVFVANYHPIQVLPYLFGFLFVGGCVVLTIALSSLADAKRASVTRLGVVLSSIGAAFVLLNYTIQTTFVPAVVRSRLPELDSVITVLTMGNPGSLAWALEMWGYAYLGLGTWLAATALRGGRSELAARRLLAGNGVIGLVGAAITLGRLEWVLTLPGLLSYSAWNVYFLATLCLVAVVLGKRSRGSLRLAHV